MAGPDEGIDPGCEGIFIVGIWGGRGKFGCGSKGKCEGGCNCGKF